MCGAREGRTQYLFSLVKPDKSEPAQCGRYCFEVMTQPFCLKPVWPDLAIHVELELLALWILAQHKDNKMPFWTVKCNSVTPSAIAASLGLFL